MANYDLGNELGFIHHELAGHDRPLRLILDGARGGGGLLLPQQVAGHEAVCGGFEYRILCVSESATLPLKDFIGVAAELQVVTDRGTLRRICGIVTEAASGQSDGGLASYQLVLRDALSVMEKKTNTRVFRDKNELDVIQLLVSEWQKGISVLGATFDLYIDAALASRQLPCRQFIMQHNESDADFVRRLMQQRGIAWFFRPGLETANGASTRQAPRIGHALVLFDDSNRLDQSAAGTIRFHRDDATEERDTIRLERRAYTVHRQFVLVQLGLPAAGQHDVHDREGAIASGPG